MSPIQRIKLTLKAKPDFRGPLELSIEGRTLSQTIDDYFLEKTRKPWPEKSHCFISSEPLRQSALAEGRYSILLCANCTQSGYDSCEDLGLKPIDVGLSEKTVTWKIGFLDWVEDAPTVPLVLTFDRTEYNRELGILADK